mmetsp:Transcript_22118/g.72830  ORF Transcript_22118/g.72830 Transcript_22118/m.72830 type:complete len:345 (+) Transcript_22118:1319-2353(+)
MSSARSKNVRQSLSRHWMRAARWSSTSSIPKKRTDDHGFNLLKGTRLRLDACGWTRRWKLLCISTRSVQWLERISHPSLHTSSTTLRMISRSLKNLKDYEKSFASHSATSRRAAERRPCLLGGCEGLEFTQHQTSLLSSASSALLLLLVGRDGEGGADRDSAHVASSLYLEVSVVSPCESPAVLDGPVGDASLCPVPNGEHSMIDLVRSSNARGGGVDAGGVMAEISNNLERNTDGVVRSDDSLHADLVSRREVCDFRNLGSNAPWLSNRIKGAGASSHVAMSIAAHVRVFFHLAQPAVVHDVLEGLGREAAVASVVLEVCRAVHELLLAQQDHLSCLDGMQRL